MNAPVEISFTSGTTSQSKIVMLSQKNICSNLYAYQTHFKILSTDTLLSFLPIHHTFESSITILYGFYCGAKVAFCDGLRYIQPNLKEYQVSVFVAVPLLLETMYKKILKGIEDKGKTKLIKMMWKQRITLPMLWSVDPPTRSGNAHTSSHLHLHAEPREPK